MLQWILLGLGLLNLGKTQPRPAPPPRYVPPSVRAQRPHRTRPNGEQQPPPLTSPPLPLALPLVAENTPEKIAALTFSTLVGVLTPPEARLKAKEIYQRLDGKDVAFLAQMDLWGQEPPPPTPPAPSVPPNTPSV